MVTEHGIVYYVSSSEDYKGFRIDVEHHLYGGSYHRSCHLYKNGEKIAIGKTKKSMKELIDYGCFK